MEPRKIIFLVAALVATLLLMVPLADFLSSTLVTTSEKPNPQGTHTVELQKNIRQKTVYFRIESNGKTVFRSPAFGRLPLDYREQVVWDPKGKRFFFEVAGQRLFGYDTLEKRELSVEEMFAIPLSSFYEMQYNGTPPPQPAAPPEASTEQTDGTPGILPKLPVENTPTGSPASGPPVFDFQLQE